MSWRRCRLDWLATEERRVVNPTEIAADAVFHYSIPALDEIGDGRLEAPDQIGSGKLLLSGGEILISKLNPRLPRVLLAEAHDVPTLASTEFIALRPGPDVDERFLRYWLGSEPLRQMLNGATMSVTRSQQRVRPDIVTKSWLTVPTTDVQHAIADYLAAETARIDALIEKKQRMVDLLRERRTLLTSDAVTGRIGIGGWHGDGESRGDRLKRVASFAAGGTPNVDDPRMWAEDGIPWVTITDMTNSSPVSATDRCASEEGIAAKRLPIGDPGTILFAMYASVGATGVLGVRATWNQAILGMWPRPQLADARFLRYWLEHLQPSLSGLTRSNTQDNLNAEVVGNLPFPAAGLSVQYQIADYLDAEVARIEGIAHRIRLQTDLLNQRRQALITAAVTGELPIPGIAA